MAVRQLTYIGIEKIGAARSGPIRASVPLWSAAVAIIFLGERITLPIALGTLLVVGGILLISWRTERTVSDFRPWYVIAPLLAAILGGVVYPLRRYALKFSDDPIYFGAIVGVVGLLCTMVFLAAPTTKDRLVWHRHSIGYFIVGGSLESLGLLLVLYAATLGGDRQQAVPRRRRKDHDSNRHRCDPRRCRHHRHCTGKELKTNSPG
jgi:drug/metabolite transporter (DMT)-like permease